MSTLSSLIKELAHLLKQKKWQIVTAESCTGGLIAGAFTEVPGSSEWFERGFVTYSNLAKHEMLGVPKELIAEFGAVSEQVAQEMAAGALKNSAGQIAVSVTGIAGPDGGSADKPVGLVCFAVAFGQHIELATKHFTGSRQDIRLASVAYAVSAVLQIVKKY
ncbi:MAG: CinA family protein [Legionella sp.]